MTSLSNTLLTAALDYARQGFKVFPCQPNGKRPLTSNGYKDATTCPEQIQQWWSAYPTANIGLSTEDLVVIDVDGKEGAASLATWEAAHGILPKTAVSITGGGGKHYVYKASKPVKCRTAVLESVDIRADGGYVIAAPSIHESGQAYLWIEPLKNIASASDVVYELAAYKKSKEQANLTVVSEGKRNNTLFEAACKEQAKGASPQQVLDFARIFNKEHCHPPLDDAEVVKIVNSVLSYPQGIALATNKDNGRVLQTIANARTILTEHEGLRDKIKWNELSHAITVVGALPWNSKVNREWDNSDDDQLLELMEAYGLTKVASIDTALNNVAYENSYNPIVDWLKGLKWDGKPRMTTILTKFLGCADTAYTRAVITLFLFGAVARVLQPGIKFDLVPILVGKQGTGKSLFIRKLSMLQEYFSDAFSTFDGDKASEKLRGIWIAELSELLALKRAKDVEGFKSFLTSVVDIYRPPYGRRTERRSRMAVFMGTTNSLDFLTDRTGNRRFLPLLCNPERVDKKDILQGWEQPKITAYFEQVWAEAYYRYITEQPKLKLPKDMEAEALKQQEAYTEEDLLAAQIQHYLENRGDHFGQYITAQEIAQQVLNTNKPSKREANEIHAVLRAVADLKFVGKQKTHFGTLRAYVVVKAEEKVAETTKEVIEGNQQGNLL